MKLYFRDNFFNAGETEILNEMNENAGHLDLKSAFGSAVDVYGQNGELRFAGSFPFFSNKWKIADARGEEIGVLRYRLSFISKKFTYDAEGRGSYEISSPAFSREYEMFDAAGLAAARFERVSGWFSASAYLLDNHCDDLDTYELVAVIMGMHAIQERQQAAATNGGG